MTRTTPRTPWSSCSACERGEVLGLRWDAIDTDTRELIVDHQLQRVRRELLYRETKTEASDDSLPLPDIVTTALTLRRAEQETAQAAASGAWRKFYDEDGQEIALVSPDGTEHPYTHGRSIAPSPPGAMRQASDA